MSIKIKIGDKVRLNNGEKHTVTDMFGDNPLEINEYEFGPFCIDGMRYHQDGRFADAGYGHDLSVKRVISNDDTTKLWRDMTPEEKGALLLADHEGKTIQRYCEHRQEWMDGSINCGEHHTYRIRPEPKRETVTLHGCGFEWSQAEQPCNIDTHRITFDTIDGEPDPTSIKMEKL